MKEIERKWIVNKDQLPADMELLKQIEQVYLSIAPEIRARRSSYPDGVEVYKVTVKSKGDLVRDELDILISANEFDNIREKSNDVVLKDRYACTVDNDITVFVDIFHTVKLDGLVIAEIEFTSKKEAESYIPEDWFGQEITYYAGFKNASLATKGIPRDVFVEGAGFLP